MAASAFNTRLVAQTDLIKKTTEFDAKLKGIIDRVSKDKSKHLLVENELKKFKTFDTNYFVGRNYFEGDDGAQNTLVFLVKSRYFRRKVNIGDGNISIRHFQKSKGSSDESLRYLINNGTVMTKLIRPTHVVLGVDEYFLQDSGNVIANMSIVNIYIVYKLSPKSINTTNALKNNLFGVVDADRLNNTKDRHKYTYSEYGIGFDPTGLFTHSEGSLGRNIIIFVYICQDQCMLPIKHKIFLY